MSSAPITVSSRLQPALGSVIKPITYPEKYSGEKYDRFIQYLNSNSHARIALDFIIPIAAVAAIVFPIFSLPFQPITDGFLSKGTAPLVCFVSSALGTCTFTYFFQHFFPEYQIKRYEFIILSLNGGISFTACLALITQFCYPFPFSTVVPVYV